MKTCIPFGSQICAKQRKDTSILFKIGDTIKEWSLNNDYTIGKECTMVATQQEILQRQAEEDDFIKKMEMMKLEHQIQQEIEQ